MLDEAKPLIAAMLQYAYSKDCQNQVDSMDDRIQSKITELFQSVKKSAGTTKSMQERSVFVPKASVEASTKVRSKELPKFQKQKPSKSKQLLVKESPSKVIVDNWREVMESTVGVPQIPESLYLVHGRTLSMNLPLFKNMSSVRLHLPEVRQSVK